MKDAYERVIGDGSKMKGVVKRMLKQYEKRSVDAFRKWKEYLHLVKHKGMLD
eukprot:CAMPEP_0168316120 /NCGR_PEP_ID=MMETSP0210-20121227/14409_1 /TAXON_ID=40633 /ORGANISM="Condylostoma magnum, Strain COL2" /LENGTH=51 /DNA_ID=CAMNT_0008294931 /DNA_START=33 /DNA_END=188 /DNA_ORIENTATION=+